LAVSFSGDGITYALARQCTLTREKLQVGLFCCTPGDDSFAATFSHFAIERS
jgi:regulation of enolase protein 1 (concanavalin A-like superfamily)